MERTRQNQSDGEMQIFEGGRKRGRGRLVTVCPRQPEMAAEIRRTISSCRDQRTHTHARAHTHGFRIYANAATQQLLVKKQKLEKNSEIKEISGLVSLFRRFLVCVNKQSVKSPKVEFKGKNEHMGSGSKEFKANSPALSLVNDFLVSRVCQRGLLWVCSPRAGPAWAAGPWGRGSTAWWTWSCSASCALPSASSLRVGSSASPA